MTGCASKNGTVVCAASLLMSLCVNLMNVLDVEIGSDLALVLVGTLGDFRDISVRFRFPLEAIWSVLSFDIQKLFSASIIFPVLK